MEQRAKELVLVLRQLLLDLKFLSVEEFRSLYPRDDDDPRLDQWTFHLEGEHQFILKVSSGPSFAVRVSYRQARVSFVAEGSGDEAGLMVGGFAGRPFWVDLREDLPRGACAEVLAKELRKFPTDTSYYLMKKLGFDAQAT